MVITDLQGRSYQDYTAFSDYQFDDGIEIVPLCKKATDPPPHFVLIRRHAPTGIRTVKMSATKAGTPPVMPDMIDTPSGDIFLGANIKVLHPLTNESGGIRSFRTEGEYRFAQHGDFGLTRNMEPDAEPDPTSTIRISPILHGGRPPYLRGVVDALSLVQAGISVLSTSGPSASAVITGLNTALDMLAANTDSPELGDPGYNDFAVDTRSSYFSEGLIR